MCDDVENSKFIDCFIWRILLFIDAGEYYINILYYM